MTEDKLWNRNYLRVMVNNFTLYFSFYLLTPLLPLYLSEHFGSTKDMIGLVLSGYTLVALLIRPFSGFWSDRYSVKRVLCIALGVYFLSFAGYLAAGTLVLFALVRTIHGGPFGAVTVSNATMAVDVLPSSRRNEGIGLYGLSNNVATAIAPTVGIWIYQATHNFDLLFGLAFLTAGIGFYNATRIHPKPKKQAEEIHLSLDHIFLLRGWPIAVNMCFFGLCWGVVSNYIAIYGKEVMGITTGTGVFFLLVSIGLITARLTGKKALQEGRLQHHAMVGMVLSTCAYFLFVACPNVVGYYASALLIGLGNGHFWPAFQNIIIGMAHHNERGTANSTILTSWDLGMGLGILLGGMLSEYLGYEGAFWVTAAVHILGLLFYFSVTRTRIQPI